ncbi:MAG: bifunctional methionine sulfoxide reductase B/A protein [Planctomycetes bacterium]|nr:bifunctional methionine sulfoxide reductase B/A protein [Planctomycetota bacterium]
MPKYSKSGYDITPLTKQRIAEIVKTLTPEQVAVTQEAATERPFCGELVHQEKPGIYVCVVGGLPLFKSGTKFDSKTGWPSFFDPIDAAHIIEKRDSTLGMERVEILDARSGAHLGHVFDDGPPPTGKRYCLNSAALKFIPDGTVLPPESLPVNLQIAYFAGGCFWGVEDVFEQIPGVLDAESGYMGGKSENPTYRDVCSHTTGHAEAVKVVFDPARVSYKDLLAIFFNNHDATQYNRQGPDVGDQYRSEIFTSSAEQKAQAENFIKTLQASDEYRGQKIATLIEMAPKFYKAEEYHQDYHKKNGGSCRVKR